MNTVSYKIDIKEYLRCVKFAYESIETNIDLYPKRNQNNVNKILNDIIIGKLGEFAVYNLLKEKSFNLNEPDLLVYDAEHKSFDADLFVNKSKIHVKTQTREQGEKYGISWCFQPNDKLTTNPDEDDYIFLCTCDDLTVDIKNFNKAKYYLNFYKEPIKDNLKNSKVVLYLKDIVQAEIKQRRTNNK